MSIAAVVNEGIHVFILFIVFVILSDLSISILSFSHSPFLSRRRIQGTWDENINL